jgi:hypothetical protein
LIINKNNKVFTVLLKIKESMHCNRKNDFK